MTARQKIALVVYAPVLVEDDSRPVAVVHGLERSFPGLRLGWTVSDSHQLIPLPQRDAWLAQARRKGGFPLICSNDAHFPVMISGMEISARSGSGGQSQSDIHADLPLDVVGIATAADALETVAEAARAYWGHATPSMAGLEIARQTKNWAANPQPPPRGLPALKPAWDIPSPEIPHRLGWVNYWSAAAVRAIGFPDAARDAELLSRTRRTATGGWIVRLTDEPLDLENPAHLDTLKRAYARFPEIGGRTLP